jgi:hypothetical protein
MAGEGVRYIWKNPAGEVVANALSNPYDNPTLTIACSPGGCLELQQRLPDRSRESMLRPYELRRSRSHRGASNSCNHRHLRRRRLIAPAPRLSKARFLPMMTPSCDIWRSGWFSRGGGRLRRRRRRTVATDSPSPARST